MTDSPSLGAAKQQKSVSFSLENAKEQSGRPRLLNPPHEPPAPPAADDSSTGSDDSNTPVPEPLGSASTNEATSRRQPTSASRSVQSPLRDQSKAVAAAPAESPTIQNGDQRPAADEKALEAERRPTAAAASMSAEPAQQQPPPPAQLKSAIKQSTVTIAGPRKAKTVYCDDCKKEIPLEEWPNHRDRLRSVEIKSRLSGLQRQITSLFVDFVMWVLVNVYFREVAVVGADRVPKTGPVVFYGNHQNQFIDAMMIRAHSGRNVRFIIAEKSMNRPVIGHFARMMEAVPVVRPQDVPSITGQGRMISMENNTICGEGTKFTENLAPGDVVSWAVPGQKDRCSGQVHAILSDTKLALTMPIKPEEKISQPTTFKCSRRIDHSEMYADVYNTLTKGGCIGIFPEGGSHDRTSLLPLKAGVALFSLGAYERGIHPSIVPCGLTYFYGHKFRSRAHIEFGEPLRPSEELVDLFSTDKRKATGLFLDQLAAALRGVTINVPDWGALKFLHAFRRLYQPSDCILTTGDYLKLTRRLALMMDERGNDAQFADFRSKVENYCDYCSALLVRDSQAATLEKLDEAQGATIATLLFRRMVMLSVMLVVLIPFFVIAAPIGLISHVASEHHAKTALSSSSVKVVAADVKGSYKIIVGFALVPVEVFTVALLVLYAEGDLRTALTVFCSLPMAMYVSLLILQEFILEVRAALPLVMSLFSKHKQFKKLFDRRQKLVHLAKTIVAAYDPHLDEELAAYQGGNANVREPSLFSLRHSSRRLADKMK